MHALFKASETPSSNTGFGEQVWDSSLCYQLWRRKKQSFCLVSHYWSMPINDWSAASQIHQYHHHLPSWPHLLDLRFLFILRLFFSRQRPHLQQRFFGHACCSFRWKCNSVLEYIYLLCQVSRPSWPKCSRYMVPQKRGLRSFRCLV